MDHGSWTTEHGPGKIFFMAWDPLKQKPDFKRHDPKDPIHKWVILFIVFLIIYGFFTT